MDLTPLCFDEAEPFRLREYQREWMAATARDRAAGFTRLLLDAVGGSGKCLGKGTPILMFDGSVKMVEDVQMGDAVMGPDSSPRRVVSLARGQEMLYRINPVKGSPFVVNESHILSFKATTGSHGWRWNGRKYFKGDVINITVREYLQQNKKFKHNTVCWRTGVEFPRGLPLDPDMPPYMLGLWLGDGTKGMYHISKPDPEIEKSVRDYAESIGHRVTITYGSSGFPTYHVVSRGRGGCMSYNQNRATAALRNLGIDQSRRIPQAYKVASREDRLHLLAGILDADGSRTNGGYDFITVGHGLCEDVAFLARSLGFAAYWGPCKKRCQTGFVGDYFRMSLSGDFSMLPVRIPRRKHGPRKQIKSVLVTGLKLVEPLGIGDYFGFQLEGPDKLFLLGDFTVTHNTTYAGALAVDEWRACQGRMLILENRQQLVMQTAKRIQDETGLEVDIEMSDHRASPHAQVVVASVASIGRVDRLTTFTDSHFAIVIADEAHNSTANLFLRTMRYFHYGADSLKEGWVAPKDGEYQPHCLVIGITATPDTYGKRNLGNFYQKFVARYSYLQAIEDGWLVGIKEVNIPVRVDTRKFRKKMSGYGTDFSAEDESAAIIPIIEELAEQIVKLASTRKTMCFLPSAECARLMADALNRRGLKALYVLGECLDRDEKTDEFRDHGTGICLCLCALYVEGTDFPDVDAVAWMRATLSPSFYKQGIYRCSRTLPGLVNDEMGAEGRRAAIAASAKPYSLLISPFFVSDKIDIMSVVDLFIDQSLKEKMKKVPTSFTDAEKIRDFIAALENAADKHKHRQARTIDPVKFSLSIGADRIAAYVPQNTADAAAASKAELDVLLEAGIDTSAIKSSGQAQKLIATLRERDRLGLATPRQMMQLTLRLGIPEETAGMMKKKQAGAIIGKHASHWHN